MFLMASVVLINYLLTGSHPSFLATGGWFNTDELLSPQRGCQRRAGSRTHTLTHSHTHTSPREKDDESKVKKKSLIRKQAR